MIFFSNLVFEFERTSILIPHATIPVHIHTHAKGWKTAALYYTQILYHKLSCLRPAILSKKRLWHIYFNLNFAISLKRPFYKTLQLAASVYNINIKNPKQTLFVIHWFVY